MTAAMEGTRRERLRAQTLAEIKQHALTQLAEGGPEALSLNAISRTMRMSGPALYRYFASRDELLAVLVVESYEELAAALHAAAEGEREPTARLRAVAAAYRQWATANPHRYRLIFASTYGSGLHAPERTIPAAHRSMTVVVDAVAAVHAASGAASSAPTQPRPRSGDLEEQLTGWAHARPDPLEAPPGVLQLGVLTWTRLHGVVSLEIAGVFTAMRLDPDLLYEAELDQILAQA